MKKSLWLIKAGFVALFSLVAFVACRNHDVNDAKKSKAVEQPALPPVKEEVAKPTDIGKPDIEKGKPSTHKVGQGRKTAPEHGTPNPGELDSLRNAMDKLREQEIKKKKKGGRP